MMKNPTKPGYRIEPIPRMRRFAIDSGYLGRRRNIVHGLIEVDITEARSYIREHRLRTGDTLSFTAFIIHCLGKAIETNRHLHAYRDWRNRLVIFDDIHINAMVETDRNGYKVPIPHIFKAVNRKSYQDLHDELRFVQKNPEQTDETQFMAWFLYLPAPLRRILYWFVLRAPHRFRDFSTTVMVTAVGMFGQGGGLGHEPRCTRPWRRKALAQGMCAAQQEDGKNETD